jgi:DNA-binding transcriptional regulator YdaS (Cro superfamily)
MAAKRRRATWRWRSPEDFDPGLRLAVKAAGGTMTDLARLLGIAPQAIAQWDEIPAGRILDIERVTKVDREKLRPDLYRRRAG